MSTERQEGHEYKTYLRAIDLINHAMMHPNKWFENMLFFHPQAISKQVPPTDWVAAAKDTSRHSWAIRIARNIHIFYDSSKTADWLCQHWLRQEEGN